MKIKLDLRPAMESVMQLLQGKTRYVFKQQGHHLSGAAEESMKYRIVYTANSVTGIMEANDYVIFVELGVKWSKKAGRRGSSGGKSKRIEGYISYWKRRGLPEREAIRAAFALKRVHDREDMPTRASYRFSRTGERTGFVRSVLTENLDEIAAVIAEKAGAQITINLADVIRLAKFTVPV